MRKRARRGRISDGSSWSRVDRANFDRFAPSSRRGILKWIDSAKRPQTRARRIADTASKAANNIKANHPIGRDRGPKAD